MRLVQQPGSIRESPGRCSNATAEGFQQHAKDEARKVWVLYKAGVVRETYFRVEDGGSATIDLIQQNYK